MFPNLLPTRRQFLSENAMGIGSIALAVMLAEEEAKAKPPSVRTEPVVYDLRPKPTQFPGKAKAMISLFMHGGPSQMELMDPKPELSRLNGTDYAGEVGYSDQKNASRKLLGSRWKFEKHGQSGLEFSELIPNIASVADDLCVIRSMHTGHNGHEVSIRYFNAGIPAVLGRPSLGSWLTYALGSESQNLPAYMVLVDPGGHPVDGVNNWSNGFMPPLFQGTVLRATEPRILNLNPPPHLKGELQAQNLAFLKGLNDRHLEQHPGEADLEARIASYELAARMQIAAKEALDISSETEATQKMYGLDNEATREYGTRCLIARRLVERGVRFVQLFLAHQPWDHHENIKDALPAICKRTDQPSAALVKDLKQRGLLDSTLVHWGGEIGRLPVTQGTAETGGRDHNGQGFSIWMAGGGIKPGMTYGESDEVGHRAVTNVVTANDYQATVMHMFGLDHSKVIYHHSGQPQQITAGRTARVVNDILA